MVEAFYVCGLCDILCSALLCSALLCSAVLCSMFALNLLKRMTKLLLSISALKQMNDCEICVRAVVDDDCLSVGVCVCVCVPKRMTD